jgi:hypothetical protein
MTEHDGELRRVCFSQSRKGAKKPRAAFVFQKPPGVFLRRAGGLVHGLCRRLRAQGWRRGPRRASLVFACLGAVQGDEAEFAVLGFVDAVFGVEGAVHAGVGFIGLHACDFGGDVFGEIELAGVGDVTSLVCFVGRAAEVDLHVDVDGASLVPTGVDGGEFDEALFAGELNAAEEAGFVDLAGATRTSRTTRTATSAAESSRSAGALGGEAGVGAHGVAVPDIDGGVFERGAGFGIHYRDAQAEGQAGAVLGQVCAEFGCVDVVGAFVAFHREGAAGRGGEAT